jgi:cysteinyl-tRNA synthetase
VFWDTDIGRGRPAWNIQDAAMIVSCVGPEIDIACGGEDNLYRHHDYTIALIESVTGKEFAHYWFHGGHLLVGGRKMSKSRGNIVYLDDLLGQGFTAEEVRFFLLTTHYRKRQSCSARSIGRSTEELHRLQNLALSLCSDGPERAPPPLEDGALAQVFRQYMDNDLDLHGAVQGMTGYLATIAEQRKKGEVPSGVREEIGHDLHRIDSVLQCIFPHEPEAAGEEY